jgi:hypothetical protein
MTTASSHGFQRVGDVLGTALTHVSKKFFFLYRDFLKNGFSQK